MPQLGHLLKYVLDTSGNAVSGASCTVYREGATVSGNQSGVSPLVVTVRHRGKVVANDTVFVNTVTGTTYNVNAVTATTVTLGGFSGTLSLNDLDRLVASGSQPTLYSDDQGGATKANPLTSSSTGLVDAYIEYGAYELLFSGGITTRLEQAQVVSTEAPGQVRYVDAFAYSGGTTGGIQEALDDLGTGGGRIVLSGNKTYTLSTEVLYAVNTTAPVIIEGGGWTTVLSLTGATNKGLHFTGIAGTTTPGVILRAFKIISNTSGTSAAGIHCDGLAVITLENIWVHGNSKMTDGIRLSGTQQGEISGGYINLCTTGLRLESSGGIASNGIDVHGVSFANSGSNIVVTGSDDTMIHHNHLTTAPIGVDFNATVAGGVFSCMSNHIESHTTAGVRISANTAHIIGNMFYPAGGGTDITVPGGANHVIEGNLLQGLLNFGAGADRIKFINNRTNLNTVLTDASTNLTKYGNSGAAAAASTFGAALQDSLTLTARETAAGDIASFLANASVSGAWGIRVKGAGVGQDIYLKLGDGTAPVIVGSTDNAKGIRILSAVAGTQWVKFNANGLMGQVVLTANLPAAGAANDGLILVEDAGVGDRNLIIYGGGQRFRIDGGVPV